MNAETQDYELYEDEDWLEEEEEKDWNEAVAGWYRGIICERYPLKEDKWIPCDFRTAVQIVKAWDDDAVILYSTEYGYHACWKNGHFNIDGCLFWIERVELDKFVVHKCFDFGDMCFSYRYPNRDSYFEYNGATELTADEVRGFMQEVTGYYELETYDEDGDYRDDEPALGMYDSMLENGNYEL